MAVRADLTGPGGTIPNAPFGADDAAAALLPNGHVFLTADAGPNPIAQNASTQAGSASMTLPTTAGLQLTWNVAQADGKNTTIPPGTVIFSVDSPTSITLGTFNSSGNLVPVNALQTQGSVPLVLGGIFSSPTQLFDFSPNAGTMTPIAAPAGSLLQSEGAFVTRMLVLPTGQLLLSDSSWLERETLPGRSGSKSGPMSSSSMMRRRLRKSPPRQAHWQELRSSRRGSRNPFTRNTDTSRRGAGTWTRCTGKPLNASERPAPPTAVQ